MVGSDIIACSRARARKLDEDEYVKKVIFLHKDWFSFFSEDRFEMKIKKTEKEILQYFDLDEIFHDTREFFERFADDPSRLMWLGQAGDIFENDDLDCGITEEQKIIVEYEGDLFELDTSPLNILDKDTPLAFIFRPLGILELSKDLERKIQTFTLKK